MPVITAKYTRNETEEFLFGISNNPTPLLEIVEQEFAWRAEGEVNVFIDGENDISALRNSLKVMHHYLGLIATNPVFGVSSKVRLKSTSSAIVPS